MEIFIETDRLILREIIEDDFMGFYELDSDPEVHKYLGNHPVTSIEQSKAVIQFIRQQYKKNGIGRWAIIDKASNNFIGWSGLKYEQHLRDGMAYYDLGYRLKRAYWGRGIATETAIESLKYGFSVFGLTEIYAAAHVENIASNKILQKIGLNFMETFSCDDAIHNWYKIEITDWELKKEGS